jgi:hypothetical protein
MRITSVSIIAAAIIAAAVLMSSCASINLQAARSFNTKIKTYDGPEKPLHEIALVKCDPFILVNGIDGNKSHRAYAGGGVRYRDCEISVMPGLHTFDVCFYESYRHKNGTSSTINCREDIPVQLDAQAGRIYRIKYENILGRWRPWIEDVTEGKQAKIEEEKSVTADSKLWVGITEEKVIELMKNNSEVVAIIPGTAHTYKLNEAGFRIVTSKKLTTDLSAEWLVTVNFRNGRVFSYSVLNPAGRVVMEVIKTSE